MEYITKDSDEKVIKLIAFPCPSGSELRKAATAS